MARRGIVVKEGGAKRKKKQPVVASPRGQCQCADQPSVARLNANARWLSSGQAIRKSFTVSQLRASLSPARHIKANQRASAGREIESERTSENVYRRYSASAGCGREYGRWHGLRHKSNVTPKRLPPLWGAIYYWQQGKTVDALAVWPLAPI